MSLVVPPRTTVILKANRDTVLLLAGATAVALAIGYSAHGRPNDPVAAAIPTPATEQVAAGEWAGGLAAVQPLETPTLPPAEPLSSAALTVPKAAMILPTVPRPAATVKPRACEGTACAPRIAAGPAVAAAAPAAAKRPSAKPAGRPAKDQSLMARLNPLNHIPDVRIPDVVKRPFAFAGDTVSGWVKRF